MPICPLDYRYGRQAMKDIFSEQAKLQHYLDVEASLVETLSKFGKVPRDAAEEVRARASDGSVKLERVKEIESEIHHDVMAVVKALTEQCPIGGKYVHMGATSYDIVDTATALQFKEAIGLLEDGLRTLANGLCDLAEKHKNTIMVGRTHGQHAIPITFGLKIAVFASEVERHYQRIQEAKKRILIGKLSGAVGTGAALGEKALEIQEEMMKTLGLRAEIPATQIVQRDRHIELLSILANIGSSVEKFATEVRNLQRSEINEVSEAFDTSKQVGSSTMAQKKNPITAENISGLARVLRAMLLPEWENAVQWHERDLANSSAERIVIPHAFIIADDILFKCTNIFKNLNIMPDNMLRNLELSKGAIMAESVMIALSSAGMGRQEAHELVRRAAMDAALRGVHLRDGLVKIGVLNHISSAELDRALDPKSYTGKSETLVEMTVERVRSAVN